MIDGVTAAAPTGLKPSVAARPPTLTGAVWVPEAPKPAVQVFAVDCQRPGREESGSSVVTMGTKVACPGGW